MFDLVTPIRDLPQVFLKLPSFRSCRRVSEIFLQYSGECREASTALLDLLHGGSDVRSVSNALFHMAKRRLHKVSSLFQPAGLILTVLSQILSQALLARGREGPLKDFIFIIFHRNLVPHFLISEGETTITLDRILELKCELICKRESPILGIFPSESGRALRAERAKNLLLYVLDDSHPSHLAALQIIPERSVNELQMIP